MWHHGKSGKKTPTGSLMGFSIGHNDFGGFMLIGDHLKAEGGLHIPTSINWSTGSRDMERGHRSFGGNSRTLLSYRQLPEVLYSAAGTHDELHAALE